MKESWATPWVRGRYPLAILAGLLLAAAFPRIGIAGLAWIAPALLLAATLGKRGGECFRIGYVGALAHYLASLYWLLLIPYRWHGIPFGPATGWLALGGFLAFFPAGWAWAVGVLVQSPKSKVHGPKSKVHGPQAADYSREEEAGSGGIYDGAAGLWIGGPVGDVLGCLPATWAGRTVWALYGAVVWVAMEMVLARIFGGFPWNLLGASQYQMVPLIQVASLTGIYGVSFLMVWFSLSLLAAAATVLRRPASRSLWAAEIFLPIMAVALAFNFGFHRLRHGAPETRTLAVTLVQPSIPQTLIWDAAKNHERFQDLLRLSEQALTNQPGRTELLIWPESAVPELLRYDQDTVVAVTSLARRHRVWMILGADDFIRRGNALKPEDGDYFNCSFLINPEGELVKRYKKQNLVIFGEYIPCAHWLPFLKWFTPIQGGYTRGRGPEPFVLKDLDATASVLICFEDVFPQVGRKNALAGTDFLVNLTNDGWFGESAEQWQHAASALFRTVENGVPLLRCTNNGLTCWIDAFGRMRQIFCDAKGTVYGPGFVPMDLPLLPRGQKPAQTFYHRHGDWFGWTCVGISALVLAWRFAATRRSLNRTGQPRPPLGN